MSELIKMFEDWLPQSIEAEGFPAPPLIALHHNGKFTMAKMAIPGEQIFDVALRKFIADLTVKELVFCVDQFTLPDQGTKYADMLAVFWWVGEYEKNNGFRFGVVNYRPPPETIIEPIDWNNTFWNERLLQMVEADHQKAMERIRKANPDTIASILEFVEITAKRLRGET